MDPVAISMGVERINPESVYDPPQGGFSQVVKAHGDTHVHLSGMVGMDSKGEPVSTNMREQTAQILENISNALDAAGADVSDVVRARILTTDAETYAFQCHELTLDWYGKHKPAQTLQEVPSFAQEPLKVEIEVTAVVA